MIIQFIFGVLSDFYSKHFSDIFSFVFEIGIRFLQPLLSWLLRGSDRKVSGDSKDITVTVEIYRHIHPHFASRYNYLFGGLSSLSFSSNLSFQESFSSIFSYSTEVFSERYPPT